MRAYYSSPEHFLDAGIKIVTCKEKKILDHFFRLDLTLFILCLI